MKFIINEINLEKLKNVIQNHINDILNSIRRDADDEWGLGEMDEIYEIESIDRIEVTRVDFEGGIKVYIDLYNNRDREEYSNTIGTLEYMLNEHIPNIELILENVIQE